MDQKAVPMNGKLSEIACAAIAKAGVQPLRMTSGAGHDAMILAPHLPSTMIFLRSPGGLSHHPNESVRVEDVQNAIAAGLHFLKDFEKSLPEMQAQVKVNHA
jgi:allantoate deiminase